jgi:hypothetical protein
VAKLAHMPDSSTIATRGLHDAPAMRRHLGVEQQGAVRPELIPSIFDQNWCVLFYRDGAVNARLLHR